MYEHLRLTATHFMPFMDLSDNDIYNCKGITCNLIKYLSRSLNFTFDLVINNVREYKQLENGSWTSVIGLIQSGVSLNEKVFF